VAAFWVLVALAVVAAGTDWIAVAAGDRRLEYAAKPAVLAFLTAAAVVLPAASTDLDARRWWFVAALVCCLAGDVVLMLPRDRFVAGLASFLVGHLLFIGGLVQAPSPPGSPPFAFSATGIVVAALVVLALEAAPGVVVVRALVARGEGALVAAVCVYIAAIVTMVVLACNVGILLAAVGAASFLLSDTLLALDRFVRPLRRGPLLVHVTYHVAQVLLVLSLLR
jgi:uncharacterized membrane protein YhhN